MARLDRRPAERIAAAGLIVQFVGGLVAAFMARVSVLNAVTVNILAWQTFIGIIPWLVTLIHLRQMRMGDDETMEWERLQAERAAGGARGQLFETDEIQAFASRNRLRIMEKYLLPTFSVLTAVLMAVVVLAFSLSSAVSGSEIFRDNAAKGIAAMVAMGIVLFLVAMYAAGMSKQADWRSLRAGASFMMFSAMFSMLGLIALVMAHFGVFGGESVIAYLMLVCMGIIVLEILLNFMLDFYRPRVEGVEPRPAFDSRLLELFTQPTGILKTVAATLDYQFGFNVSETWVYRMIERAIMPFLLFVILVLYLMTTLLIVGPEEKAVVERFGVFQKVVGPGFSWKWPWPIDQTHRFAANDVKVLYLGHAGERLDAKKMLWTEKHYETEYDVIVGSRTAHKSEGNTPAVNLMVVSASVRYRIVDPKQWYYACSHPAELLESLCNREVMMYFAKQDFFDIMCTRHAEASKSLRNTMQAAVMEVRSPVTGEQGLGIEILDVSLEGIHPPVHEQLPQEFQRKSVAEITAKVTLLNAEQKQIKFYYEGCTRERELITEAEADYKAMVVEEAARAKRFEALGEEFDNLGKAHADAQSIFLLREYLNALQEATARAGVRIYVVSVEGLDREHVRLNLQDAVELDVTSLEKLRNVAEEGEGSEE